MGDSRLFICSGEYKYNTQYTVGSVPIQWILSSAPFFANDANDVVETFQKSVPPVFHFCESKFLSTALVEYILESILLVGSEEDDTREASDVLLRLC